MPSWDELIPDPATDHLEALTSSLLPLDGPADEAGRWPDELWNTLKEAGAPLWALPEDLGGASGDRQRLLSRYARIAEGSLAAAFILTQHDAAIRRLAAAAQSTWAREWLGKIARGEAFATVGISHLTTSRRLGDRPIAVVGVESGFRLQGAMPWVTAAERADVIVSGGPLDDGRQILAAIPTDRKGLVVAPSFALAALQASCTTEVRCDNLEITREELLAGPATDVMAHPGAAGTGGLETTALALGQARAALLGILREANEKPVLHEPLGALIADWREAWLVLMEAAQGKAGGAEPGQARGRANGLVLRATQAYLTVRKGSGFLRSDPAQRWARQALFFLVWSCPGPVAQAAIRDLARLCPL